MTKAVIYVNKRVLLDGKLIWTTEDTEFAFEGYGAAQVAQQAMDRRDELNDMYASSDMYYSCETV